MRIRFLGAAGDVTGSAYQVVTNDASILIDCGFFQGRREEAQKNRRKAQIEGKLDAVVLTHGHLDHVGRLPLLTHNGYKGPIYGTRATLDLATLVLKDSTAIQKQDLKRTNRKRARKEQPPLEPLFIESDVRKLAPLGSPVKYNQRFPVAPGIEARLVDAGHVIGSSSIERERSQEGCGLLRRPWTARCAAAQRSTAVHGCRRGHHGIHLRRSQPSVATRHGTAGKRNNRTSDSKQSQDRCSGLRYRPNAVTALPVGWSFYEQDAAEVSDLHR